eukprot:TRINITY_DN18150_c0_g1_i1.p1 TRINITY_DN18150_c0_g1~~TRINITY_DN18150_c0_g1_i1.p1  ORF type:complete len:142 (-),score=22.92 TRINITY_DN18150_c0_g1_i1:3-428(-)
MDETDPRSQIENSIQAILWTIDKLAITTELFATNSQQHYFQQINELLKQFAHLHSLRDTCNIDVPVEILTYIDEGKNPDLLTRRYLEELAQRNDSTRGKIHFMQVFKDLLEADLKAQLGDDFLSNENSYPELNNLLPMDEN